MAQAIPRKSFKTQPFEKIDNQPKDEKIDPTDFSLKKKKKKLKPEEVEKQSLETKEEEYSYTFLLKRVHLFNDSQKKARQERIKSLNPPSFPSSLPPTTERQILAPKQTPIPSEEGQQSAQSPSSFDLPCNPSDEIFSNQEERTVPESKEEHHMTPSSEPPNRPRVPAPKVGREGGRTIWENFGTICSAVNRPVQHLLLFCIIEFGAPCSLDSRQERLIIRGRFYPKQVEKVFISYYKEYIRCDVCKSSLYTQMVRDKGLRMDFLKCSSCFSSRSVASLKHPQSKQSHR